MITGFNKNVATKPFEKKEIESTVKSGFAKITQKHSLTELDVIFGTNNIFHGCKVYVNSENFKMPWATRVYSLDGQDFILVPEDFILLVKRPEFTAHKVSGAISANLDNCKKEFNGEF